MDIFLFLALLSDQKRGKSHQRERSTLFEISPLSRRRQPTHCVHWFIPRVHELVARSSAWQVRATNGRAKVYSFALPAISIIPRVRTYHTKKPSRFVHALSARPLKVHGGREFSLVCTLTVLSKISPISLCSHQDTHPNLNREVHHSLTWHSSESESALERF